MNTTTDTEAAATVQCRVCCVDRPETAFPTDPAAGRDFRACRSCVRSQRAAAQRPDFIHPKVQAVIDDAESKGLRVEVHNEHAEIVAVTVRKSEAACEGDNMLAVMNRADWLHLIFVRRTGAFRFGERSALTNHGRVRGLRAVRSAIFVMGL